MKDKIHRWIWSCTLFFFSFWVLFSIDGYAASQEEMRELIPMIFGCDANGDVQTISYCVPMYLEENAHCILSVDYVAENCEKYYLSYVADGQEYVEEIECFEVNNNIHYAIFTLKEGSSYNYGFPWKSTESITKDTELIYFGMEDDGTLYFCSNNCSRIEGGYGYFTYETNMTAALGGGVFDAQDYTLVGVVLAGEGFITIDEIIYGGTDTRDENKSDKNDEKTGEDEAGKEDRDDREKRDDEKTFAECLSENKGIVVITVILIAGIAGFFAVKNKERKGNTDTKQDGFVEKEATDRLIGVGGEHAGAVIPLTEPIVFGRDKNKCNLMFPDTAQGISAIHCQINKINGRVELTDLGSTYGTFLEDGTKLTPYVPQYLSSGQGFYLADRKYSYKVE